MSAQGSPSKKAEPFEQQQLKGWRYLKKMPVATKSTLLQAEKVKPKIVDVDQEELDNAFRRNQVTAVNALVAQYQGGWKFACQPCFELATTGDHRARVDGEWVDCIRVSQTWLCRHVLATPGETSRATSCYLCRTIAARSCTPMNPNVVTAFRHDLGVRHRVRAGLRYIQDPAVSRRSLFPHVPAPAVYHVEHQLTARLVAQHAPNAVPAGSVATDVNVDVQIAGSDVVTPGSPAPTVIEGEDMEDLDLEDDRSDDEDAEMTSSSGSSSSGSGSGSDEE
ncbi:hypothetical protein HD553DRAFT_342999 [Filobasidium floriforme]|uniref:uncharacterized protein n=1 Tax=Filobasidium floriforme TaxID=5210 RepID=UPI001E8EA953|nr:uncharacterized protein HD553DRAFT_342999 [Filobasidium floriforme]KAH8083017.1 hypothetical protein HD553DRAFT_342999 [Filobasidium floriforme]